MVLFTGTLCFHNWRGLTITSAPGTTYLDADHDCSQGELVVTMTSKSHSFVKAMRFHTGQEGGGEGEGGEEFHNTVSIRHFKLMKKYI